MHEHWPRVTEGAKLATLAAWLDRVRQLVEQGRVVAPSGDLPIEHARIQAGQDGAEPAVDHLAGQGRRRPAPERKDRLEPRAGQTLFAVAAHVFEKQVAERDVCE